MKRTNKISFEKAFRMVADKFYQGGLVDMYVLTVLTGISDEIKIKLFNILFRVSQSNKTDLEIDFHRGKEMCEAINLNFEDFVKVAEDFKKAVNNEKVPQ